MKQQLETVFKDIPVPDTVHARMEQGLRRKKRRHRLPQLILAASLLIGLLQYDRIESWIQPPNDQSTASMLPGLVYQEKMYIQADTTISGQAVSQLRGRKLGTSENTLTEENETTLSKQPFASNLTDYTIYELEGYAPSIRLLAIGQEDGQRIVRILDQTTFRPDYFRHLRLDQTITHISYQTERTRDSERKASLAPSASWTNLLTGLSTATPLADSELPSSIQNHPELRMVDVTLADGVTNQFQLMKGGYLFYEPIHAYFDVKGTAFETVWAEMH